MRRIGPVLLLSVLALGMGACTLPQLPPIGGTGGELNLRSAFDPDAVLQGDFDTAIYSAPTPNSVKIVLFEGPVDDPSKACVIRLLWKPSAAQTPIDADATNATIQLVVFEPSDSPAGEEIGVYSGAGYMFIKHRPGRARIGASVWQATLVLTESSGQFEDRLGESELTGRLILERNEPAVERLNHRINAMVATRLGYPRLVEAEPASPPLAAR